ncbi:MAG: proteasome accessory factor PafA2 family protein [Desulfomonilaceae bacterium]|nr:proteasome accessory factor PafA2 family protein [Desulfomonilaceae bacterium]
MSIPKVVGIEQEYALTVRGTDRLTPFQASSFLINSYARAKGLRDPGIGVLWDYGHETPFQDIRGGLFSKSTNREIISAEDNLRINTVLPNGARLYTDHGHPEYSTPECLSARDVTACDKAGERVLREALDLMRKELPTSEVSIFKNNVDYQGHSYGCHENYLMDAAAHEKYLVRNPEKAVRGLIPFLVTRQVFTGAGKIGGEVDESRATRYQLSQRADFLEQVFGVETMYARPIINTRAEHHADDARFKRLHLILGDSNMCEWSAFLKIGTTQIVLQMMEDDVLTDRLEIAEPLSALKRISADFSTPVDLADGRRLTAMEIQRSYLHMAHDYLEKGSGPGVPEAEYILEQWAYALDGLDRLRLSDDFRLMEDPLELARRLDWVLKLWFITRFRENKDRPWDTQGLRVLDLQYHNIQPLQGIFGRLQEQGLTERLVSESDIVRFFGEPPADTRAHFRGKCVEKFAKEVCLVNWEVVGFDHGDIHRMVPLLNPLKGTKELCQDILEKAETSRDLIRILRSGARE